MKIDIRHIIMPLLVAALVSLGIAQAGTDFCPPGCNHCLAVAAESSCCDDMPGNFVAHPPQYAANEQHPPGCEHGSYCPGGSPQDEVVASSGVPYHAPGVALLFKPVITSPVYPANCSAIGVKAPPLSKPPAIYTLNCSLLI